MLQTLYEMETYFGSIDSLLFEEDLVARFGAEATLAAIRNGDLEHRWTPCASGKRRCVCALSDKGRQKILKGEPDSAEKSPSGVH